ncbi:ribosome assembly RNA-binding protein YhbY [Natroniella sulfidigena]|uniref:ribosome assembly RNA-binding protein YhbY n=1 Tax=Natroniella sulfidigena TaxID=723921 RepID=UPI00200A06CB|nr:ribosome assembly RNA-binding protein YhbY [Natroniella sulfidigena]MCK8815883.1 ribosome assembly RNA-binding protein YhbY [Natroniella sulfidigena]
MLTGKERSYLRGEANEMNPLFQVGKDGISENLVKQVEDALKARELIKLRTLNNSMYTSQEAAYELAEQVNADVVQIIGNVFVLYRKNQEENKYNLH